MAGLRCPAGAPSDLRSLSETPPGITRCPGLDSHPRGGRRDGTSPRIHVGHDRRQGVRAEAGMRPSRPHRTLPARTVLPLDGSRRVDSPEIGVMATDARSLTGQTPRGRNNATAGGQRISPRTRKVKGPVPHETGIPQPIAPDAPAAAACATGRRGRSARRRRWRARPGGPGCPGTARGGRDTWACPRRRAPPAPRPAGW